MWHVYTNIIMLLALNTFNSYSVERILSIVFISFFGIYLATTCTDQYLYMHTGMGNYCSGSPQSS